MPASTPLLVALRRIRGNDRNRTKAEGLPLVQALLQEGADPNQADDIGMTPLLFLATDEEAGKAMRSRANAGNHLSALRSLLKAGADTMAHDGAFYRTASEECIVETLVELLQARTLVIDGFLAGVERLSIKATGQVMPVLMNLSPKLLCQARKRDDSTFLHVVWGRHIPAIVANEQGDRAQLAREAGMAWSLAQYAIGVGADIHAKNQQGQRVIDLMLAGRGAGFPAPLMDAGLEPVMRILRAESQAEALAQGVPVALSSQAKPRF